MKKFVFTLHKLYDVKQSEENQKRVELKGLDKVMSGLRKQRLDMQQAYDGQQELYCRKCKTGMSMTEVKMFGEYFKYLSVESRGKDLEIAVCRGMQEAADTPDERAEGARANAQGAARGI